MSESPPPQRPQALIDALAPDFQARSTAGPVQLSDFRGKWLVFFSHPADFTPVCTSEFIAFQKAASRFEALNCALLGLSVDSLYAHLGWIKAIEKDFGIKIAFPIIEDISMSVARAYGMIHDQSNSTATVRATHFIDPDGIIRATIHYPMQVGRSIEEIVRVLHALQTAHDKRCVTPEGWRPGDHTLLPPPDTMVGADEREQSTSTDEIWYFSKDKSDH